MFAGSDFLLMPSRFEPCGLSQMYAQRFGSLPIAHRTGGLADTIIDANHAALDAGVATGIQFLPVDADGLKGALLRAIALYGEPAAWQRLQRNGMKADVSWSASAARYATLYRDGAAPG